LGSTIKGQKKKCYNPIIKNEKPEIWRQYLFAINKKKRLILIEQEDCKV
jgi:hypothetical protein